MAGRKIERVGKSSCAKPLKGVSTSKTTKAGGSEGKKMSMPKGKMPKSKSY